jgi:hypothetical protein
MELNALIAMHLRDEHPDVCGGNALRDRDHATAVHHLSLVCVCENPDQEDDPPSGKEKRTSTIAGKLLWTGPISKRPVLHVETECEETYSEYQKYYLQSHLIMLAVAAFVGIE